MKTYEPDYVYMFPIKYKSQEIFYETFTNVPARVRGAYIIDEDKQDKIDFTLIGPDGYVPYWISGNHNIFDFWVTFPGRYKVQFTNRYVNTDLRVTFTMNTGQNPILKKEDLSFAEQRLINIHSFVKRLDTETKMKSNVNHERYKSN
jgi:hypothetical protein